MSTLFDQLAAALAAERPAVLATVVRGPAVGAKLLLDGPDQHGTLGDPALDEAVIADAAALLSAERSATQRYSLGSSEVDVLIAAYPPPPHLVIVGAGHLAIPLAAGAKLLGFRVTVVDPRTTFLTRERFPTADALIDDWPDEALAALDLSASAAVAVLTHDPKLDDPAVQAALRSPARYVGALGSRQTQATRRDTLRALGVSEADLARIHGPIGLPIGAATPAEIAISILAELIAVWRGKAS